MCSFVDKAHERANIACPVVQKVSGIFCFAETNNAIQTINLCFNGFVDYQRRQEFLSFLNKPKIADTGLALHIVQQ